MTVGPTVTDRSPSGLRVLNAGNRGPFTLDGTRTYIVGTRAVAVIDPGPEDPVHVGALLEAVGDASHATVLLTHGHRDHAGAASALAAALACDVCGPGDTGSRRLGDGQVVPTDAGALVTVTTPGHAREHVCFTWQAQRAVFVGDLLLGEGNTTWVAGYPGCVADYLTSLDRIEALRPGLLYPAHGPPLDRPDEAIERFRTHRLERVDQVRRALSDAPGADARDLVDAIYGPDLPRRMVEAAVASVEAVREYIETHGRP